MVTHAQDTQPSARPLTHHRPSLSSSSSALPGRQSSHARTNSHSLLTVALNANHRVTRRKSVNAGTNVAALAAAIRDGADAPGSSAVPIANASRRNTMAKAAASRTSLVGSLPSPPPSLLSPKSMGDVNRELHGSAVVDETQDGSGDEGKVPKARVRRASDGQPLTKDGKKSNRVEVQCEKCGKSYKHSSCLTKHLWEHTPEWSYTSKLLISKHQQVQLLEAASVLVAMNGVPKDGEVTPPESAKDFGSEPESLSPAASGYSENEGQSSADTTPPPMTEGSLFTGTSYRDKRHSSMSGYSRSYQSAPSAAPLVAGSAPNGGGLGHLRQSSRENRPTSSGLNNTGQEDRDLAAAVELLSCSFGSNNGSQGTVTLPADAPPVPPVPAQYLEQAASLSNAGFINSFPRRQPESFTRGEMRRDSVDVKMEDSGDSSVEDDDFDKRSPGRSDEDDDGVFGRMEE